MDWYGKVLVGSVIESAWEKRKRCQVTTARTPRKYVNRQPDTSWRAGIVATGTASTLFANGEGLSVIGTGLIVNAAIICYVKSNSEKFKDLQTWYLEIQNISNGEMEILSAQQQH